MANVKTAISLRQSLFDEAERLARELGVSRSQVFARALEAFIRQHENQTLLDQINAAYEDSPDTEEQAQLRGMRRLHRRALAADD